MHTSESIYLFHNKGITDSSTSHIISNAAGFKMSHILTHIGIGCVSFGVYALLSWVDNRHLINTMRARLQRGEIKTE